MRGSVEASSISVTGFPLCPSSDRTMPVHRGEAHEEVGTVFTNDQDALGKRSTWQRPHVVDGAAGHKIDMLSKRHFRVDDLYPIVLDSLTRCGLIQGGVSSTGESCSRTLFRLRVRVFVP